MIDQPVAPPCRRRNRPPPVNAPVTDTPIPPAPKRRRMPSASATRGTVNEHTLNLPPQQADILLHPAVPYVDAIADAMVLRMQDAGLLRDNAPQPVPQSASSEQPDNFYRSSTGQALDTGMDLFTCNP